MSQQSWGGQSQWNAPSGGGWNAPGQQGYSQGGFGQNYGRPYGGTQTQTRWPAPQTQPYGQQNYPQQYPAPGGFPAPQQRPRGRGGCAKLLVGAFLAVILLGVVSVVLSRMMDNTTTTTQGTYNGPYQNEEYQPPPPDLNPPALPQPETYEEATTWLEQNPFYEQSVPSPVRCELPDINMSNASDAKLEEHLNNLMECLMRVWSSPVEAAGYQMPRPSVTVYGGEITTACGKAKSHNAFYCGADQQVYYANDLPDVIPPELQGARFVVESVVAHEFAHAIQGRTGLLISAMAWQQKLGKDDGKVYSRRLETQADCLAGEFLFSISASKAMTQDDLDNLSLLFYNIGDDVLTGKPNYDGEHGLGKNRKFWAQMGLASKQVSACNTFVAPENQVR